MGGREFTGDPPGEVSDLAPSTMLLRRRPVIGANPAIAVRVNPEKGLRDDSG